MSTPQQFKDFDAVMRFAEHLVERGELATDSITYARLKSWEREYRTRGKYSRRPPPWIGLMMATADRIAANHYDQYVVWVTLERLTRGES